MLTKFAFFTSEGYDMHHQVTATP